MQYVCPSDGSPLERRDGKYFCSKCSGQYTVEVLCPQCGSVCERLAACGSVSFFCNSCNAVKSKSTVTVKINQV